MAAIWTITMRVTDLAHKLVHVTATRTDGLDVRTYELDSQIDKSLRTGAAILAEVRNHVRAMYVEQKAQEISVAALLTGYETALADALNAQEA